MATTPVVDRRTVIGAALVAFLVSGRQLGLRWPDDVARAQGNPATPFVDIHCHIFNATDLPLGGFLYHVIVREKAHDIYKSLIGAFINFPKIPVFIDLVAKVLAAENKDEDEIAALAPGSFKYPGVDPAWKAADQRMLRRFLLSIRLIAPPPGNILDFTLPAELVNRDHETAARAIRFLIGAAGAFVSKADTHSRATLASLKRYEEVDRNDLAKLEIALQDVELHIFGPTGSTEIAMTIKWLLKLMRRRTAILSELDSLTSLPGRFRFYTPALVDFDYWLEDNVYDTDVKYPPSESLPGPRQVALMEKLSLAQPQGYALNGFVAFDPLRAVVEWLKAGKVGEPKALTEVKDAILKHGCLGVKLYPPMGFWPWDNLTNIQLFIADKDLGPWQKLHGFGGQAAKHFLNFEETELPLYDSPGETWFVSKRNKALRMQATYMDQCLTQLYDFCAENDVPIMTHCSRGQGSFDAWLQNDRYTSARRASPKFWKALLDAGNGRYRNLRINLGHMGGVWCLAAPYDAEAKEYESKYCDIYTKPGAPYWSEALFALIAADDDKGEPLYPNLFTDLSDWEEAISDDKKAKKAWVAGQDAVEQLLGSAPEHLYKRASLIPKQYEPIRLRAARVRSRMMYGTDWILLGRAHGYEQYFANLTKGLNRLFSPAENDGFLGGNALRYLGLTPNASGGMDKPMVRLVEFYVANKLPEKANELLAAFGHTTRVPA
jgi:predicted TIM-barrel fold metal-dependent hydrolase